MTNIKPSTEVRQPIHEEPTSTSAASKSDQFSAVDKDFLLAQYTSLREEVLKRIEIQHQLILGVLLALGTILTVSTQGGSATNLLFYPFLVLFLALAWSQNDTRNRQITEFLSSNEEHFLSDISLGWEHARTSSRLWIFGSRKVFAARGIFVGSQVLTLLLFWLRVRSSGLAFTQEDSLLIIIAIGVTIFTVLIIGFPSPSRRQKASSK
jgi:hypothetical protein